MANSSTQGNVTQSSGHTHTATNTALKYRSTNSGQPLAHADVDDNFEILRQAINGVVADIDAVVKTDVPTGAVFTDTTYVAVTDTVSGLMTGAMKQKLDGIAENAEVNVQADWNATTGDALILNKPNIAYTSAIPVATTSANGLMSLADKTKLDGIQAGATAGGGGGASVTTDPTAPSNPSDGDLWFNENEAELYVYTASLGAWIQTNGGGSGGGEVYESAETALPAVNQTVEWTHGLGQAPEFIELVLRCKVAEHGYSVGDEVRYTSEYSGASLYNFWANSTKIGFRGYLSAGASLFNLVRRDTTGATTQCTPANWKVIVRASVGTGGGNSAGIQRTQWEYQAVEGLNWINSLSLKGEPGELWKYSPLPRYQTGLPNAWVFSGMRCLNGHTVHSFEVYRDGDLVKFFGGNSSESHGATSVSVSDPAAYNNGGYILAQTSEYGNLTGVTSRGTGQGFGVDGNLMGYINPNVTSDVIINSTNIGTSWVTMNTGKPNSLVYLLVEPIAGQVATDVKIKQKGDAQIESVPRPNTWGGGGCSTLVVTGENDTGGASFWRGGYSFCMTDSNGDLEVLTGAASTGAKVTMIGWVTADLTKADVQINNGNLTVTTDDLNAVVTPSDGTTISTGLSGYNLVFLKTIGTNDNNVYYRTPGDTLKGYPGNSYSGWGCNGGCLNTNLGTYAVAMTDSNGDLKAFSSNTATIKTIIKGSVPITLA